MVILGNAMEKNSKTGLYLPPHASDYSEAGASFQRAALKAFRSRSFALNQDIDWNNRILRQRARALYMSTPIATGAVQTNRTKIVGVGLSFKSAPNREILGLSPEAAKDWKQRTEREFKLWANKPHCDETGVNNFQKLQHLVLMAGLMSGDVFALPKRDKPTLLNPYPSVQYVSASGLASTIF